MELINKEFNIWACDIMELAFKEIEVYLNLYENAPLNEFAFLCTKTGEIVLIKGFKNFELYKIVIPSYLGAKEEKKQYIRDKCQNIIPDDNFDILDRAVEERYFRDTLRILRKQSYDTYLDDNFVDFIETDTKNKVERQFYLFNYGIMLGKRMERAKKKAANRNKRLTANS